MGCGALLTQINAFLEVEHSECARLNHPSCVDLEALLRAATTLDLLAIGNGHDEKDDHSVKYRRSSLEGR